MKRTLRAFAALTALVMAGMLGVATRTHAQAVATGSIAGTVTDANGKGLSGVQITVTDTGDQDITNANGYFVITNVLPGTHTVEAALVGYETVRAENVVVTQDLLTTVNLKLERREVRETGVTRVVAPLIRKNVTPTLYTVTSQEEQLVRSQPNNLYQYPGALASQPGIVPDADGYPTVRGSRITEVGYMLDGILIVEPSSSGFATNLVTVGMDRMNVYTGGYKAELGSAIGGVINATVKTGASIRGAAVETNLGSWKYAGLVYEQGNVEKNGLNWYVSGNFWRTNFEKNHQLESLPASIDAVAKVVQPIGKKDRLTAFYTGGLEHYNFPIIDPFTGNPWGADPSGNGGVTAAHNLEFNEKTNSWVTTPTTQDYQVQMHHIGSLTWAHAFSPSSALTLQGYAWERTIGDNEMSDYSSFDYRGNDTLAAGKIDWSNQFGSKFGVRIGGELIDAQNFNRAVFFGQPGIAPGVQHRVRDADTTDLNGYVSATWKPTQRLNMDLGLRYDSRTYHRQITEADLAYGRATTQAADRDVLAKTGMDPKYSEVTPRVGVTFSVNPNLLLKASGGRFLQFAPSNYIERQYIPTLDAAGGGNANYYPSIRRKVFDVGPEKVDGYDVGFEAQLSKTLGLAVTPYWRKTKDMFDYGNLYDDNGNLIPGGPGYSNFAHGTTKGVETKIQLRETGGVSGWLTYTYQTARANVTGAVPGAGEPVFGGGEEHRLDYDQKHTIYVVGQWKLGKFEINPMLELGSGYPWGGQSGDDDTGQYGYSPIDGETLLPILVDGKLQEAKVNPYNTGWHDNLSVTFRYYTDKARTNYLFLQVQNILNSKDVTAKYWQDPNTGSNWFGFVNEPVTYTDDSGATHTADGYFEYKPWTRIPPVFVLFGVRQTF